MGYESERVEGLIPRAAKLARRDEEPYHIVKEADGYIGIAHDYDLDTVYQDAVVLKTVLPTGLICDGHGYNGYV